MDWHKVLGLAPDHVAFNGRASQYAEHPLEVHRGGGIFETRLPEPGDYPFVTHAFDDATKGAVGVFRAMRANQTVMQGNRTATMQH